jgi:L-ascorbate metabolism protein UlaG (beta-lactamase superfamily)
MSNQNVRNYSRPVSLGGRENPDPDAVSLRWFGTANFELAFGDKVILLDNFYDRPAGDRSLGFTVDEVQRADLLLVGHPHFDHVADSARVSHQTGAKVAIAPLGADYLTSIGFDRDRIISVPGLGAGDVIEGDGFTVTALHGFHLEVELTPEQRTQYAAVGHARDEFEASFFPWRPTQEEIDHGAEIGARGILTPQVNTEATITYIIDIGGFRVAYRDSGGPISVEERAYFTENPGVDVAILSINGMPQVAYELEHTFLPLAKLYQPKVLVPSHHDEHWVNLDRTGLPLEPRGIFKNFTDVATEPIKQRVHDELPDTITVQPGLVEPLVIGRAKGDVTLGETYIQ